MSVDRPLVPIVTYIYHSFIEMAEMAGILWPFKINADISILDKSVILGLPNDKLYEVHSLQTKCLKSY